MTLFLALGMITGLFIILLIFKAVIKKEYCALCGSVVLTWITLLILNKRGFFSDTLIIGILVGQTTHGVYSLFASFPKRKIYSLPVLLLLTAVAYYIISSSKSVPEILITFSILIILLAVLYLFTVNNHHQKVKYVLKQLANCCKNW
mgnify:CR=1 FL=1